MNIINVPTHLKGLKGNGKIILKENIVDPNSGKSVNLMILPIQNESEVGILNKLCCKWNFLGKRK
jgi:hypothetical protein